MSSLLSKTLITGASGMVGSYVDFGIKTDRKTLDITNLKDVLSFVRKSKPKVILHLAACTDLDFLEKNPAEAYLINSAGVYNIALAAREVGAKIILPSSTGVFDGRNKKPYTEKDLPNPQNEYGHSKYIAEQIVMSMNPDFVIARSCWMFGGGETLDKKFVAKIIAQIAKKETMEIKALNDVIGSPTFGKDLVEAYKKIILGNKKGVIHLTNNGVCTRFDVAKAIVEMLRPEVKVRAVDGSFFNLPAIRVKNEATISRKLPMRPWKEALKEYLMTEWADFRVE